ncbi:hypothetical protein C8Q80DRAFT_199222 [Daedaleopsis nitida]|nr:hypothetical protein C8Q80DRAFT_199222 [Daedaleopsis nitida]
MRNTKTTSILLCACRSLHYCAAFGIAFQTLQLCYNHEVKDNSPITYSPLSQCYSNVVLDNVSYLNNIWTISR